MTSFNLETLPGADLIKRGAEDIELSSPIPFPEHKLYLLLAQQKGDAAHSAYNALTRRLVSFERAAACAS